MISYRQDFLALFRMVAKDDETLELIAKAEKKWGRAFWERVIQIARRLADQGQLPHDAKRFIIEASWGEVLHRQMKGAPYAACREAVHATLRDCGEGTHVADLEGAYAFWPGNGHDGFGWIRDFLQNRPKPNPQRGPAQILPFRRPAVEQAPSMLPTG
jgi:hypothetical protein